MSNIATRKRLRTTNELISITPKKGDVFVDTTKPTVVIGDDVTAGGIPLAQENHSHPNSTQNTGGFMSALDKIKLDQISASGAITFVQSSGTTVTPSRSGLNFNNHFTLADDAVNQVTTIRLSDALIEGLQGDAIIWALILS